MPGEDEKMDCDQTVPQPVNGYMYDPEAPIWKENLPPYVDPGMESNLPIYTSLRIPAGYSLQVADDNLQGYYLIAKNVNINGNFGSVLIKYFNNRGNEITRQAREYYMQIKVAGEVMTDKAMAAVNMINTAKNTERELKFVRRLDHPNIVKILAYISPSGTHEEINAIVMEGTSDGPLNIYLTRNKPIQLPAAILYAFQLASALAYCHEQGIIHRDVRPKNIYVFDNGTTLKLGNFGFARVSRDGPMTANKGEEIYYKAPEMIFAGPLANYGFPVDVYSYGMVLWTICHNGEKPFQDIDEKILKSGTKFREYLECENEDRKPLNRPKIALDRGDVEARHFADIIETCWVSERFLGKRPTMPQIVSNFKDSFSLFADA